MANKIFIGNLSYSASPEDLKTEFAKYGSIKDARIVRDHASGKSRGFGFVTFESDSDAKQALDMDGKELHGRKLRVNEARERQHEE